MFDKKFEDLTEEEFAQLKDIVMNLGNEETIELYKDYMLLAPEKTAFIFKGQDETGDVGVIIYKRCDAAYEIIHVSNGETDDNYGETIKTESFKNWECFKQFGIHPLAWLIRNFTNEELYDSRAVYMSTLVKEEV